MSICSLLKQCKAFSNVKKVILCQIVIRRGRTTMFLIIIVRHNKSINIHRMFVDHRHRGHHQFMFREVGGVPYQASLNVCRMATMASEGALCHAKLSFLTIVHKGFCGTREWVPDSCTVCGLGSRHKGHNGRHWSFTLPQDVPMDCVLSLSVPHTAHAAFRCCPSCFKLDTLEGGMHSNDSHNAMTSHITPNEHYSAS